MWSCEYLFIFKVLCFIPRASGHHGEWSGSTGSAAHRCSIFVPSWKRPTAACFLRSWNWSASDPLSPCWHGSRRISRLASGIWNTACFAAHTSHFNLRRKTKGRDHILENYSILNTNPHNAKVVILLEACHILQKPSPQYFYWDLKDFKKWIAKLWFSKKKF